jgi:PadR family transcriptional regulator PadR
VAGSDPRLPGYPQTTLFFVRGSKSSENHGSCEHSAFFGSLPVAFPKEVWHSPVGKPKEGFMGENPDVLQGTLALMVLKTLDVLGPLHGYGIARRIEQISGDLLAVNQGTLYPLLLRLEQEGAIASEWGASENNRRARFYRLTRAGHKLLESETRDWEQTAAIIARFFEVKAEDLS